MKPTTTEEVIDLMDGFVTSAALGAAMELGLFWLLAEGPFDTPEVAENLGIPLNRCQYWLQIMDKVGLVERVEGGYVPSPTARAAILEAYSQEAWAFLAREWRDRFPAVYDLPVHIGELGSAWEAQGLTPPDYFEKMLESPERARLFTRMLYEVHLPYAEAIADTIADCLDMRGVERLMDLGGGSGVVSLALLRRYPQLTAVVVDIASVCAEGREIAKENSLEERIRYHAADFTQDELPSGFDLVLDCDAGAYSETMLPKIRATLNPGGRLVIVDQFAPAKGVAPSSRLVWAFQGSMESPHAAFPVAAEVKSRLRGAGFQVLSERPVPPQEAIRWLEDWVLIEARK